VSSELEGKKARRGKKEAAFKDLKVMEASLCAMQWCECQGVEASRLLHIRSVRALSFNLLSCNAKGVHLPMARPGLSCLLAPWIGQPSCIYLPWLQWGGCAAPFVSMRRQSIANKQKVPAWDDPSVCWWWFAGDRVQQRATLWPFSCSARSTLLLSLLGDKVSRGTTGSLCFLNPNDESSGLFIS